MDADFQAFSPILYYDPQLVAELAMGAEHPHEIAERYGYAPEDYETLAALPWFAELVARRRTELHEDGALFQAKAAMMAETLFVRLFQQSMVGALAAPLTVEVAKQLSDIGRLKPQPQGVIDRAGAPFQINIQVNGTDVVTNHNPLVQAPIGDVAPALVMDFAGEAPPSRPPPDASLRDVNLPADRYAPDPIPENFPPPPIKVPDFDLRFSSLAGNPQARAAATSTPPLDRKLGLP